MQKTVRLTPVTKTKNNYRVDIKHYLDLKLRLKVIYNMP